MRTKVSDYQSSDTCLLTSGWITMSVHVVCCVCGWCIFFSVVGVKIIRMTMDETEKKNGKKRCYEKLCSWRNLTCSAASKRYFWLFINYGDVCHVYECVLYETRWREHTDVRTRRTFFPINYGRLRREFTGLGIKCLSIRGISFIIIFSFSMYAATQQRRTREKEEWGKFFHRISLRTTIKEAIN